MGNNLTLEPSFFDCFKDDGQCVEHIGCCFHRVVEHYNITGTDVACDLLSHPVGRDFLVVVFRDVVPHYHPPTLASHPAYLVGGDAAIGWAEKASVRDELPCTVGACHIVVGGGEPASGVVVGVVSDSVPFFEDFIHEFGVEFGVVAEAEEGCFGIILVENLKYLFGDFGCGTVVEGEIDAILTLDFPQHCGCHSPYELGDSEVHFSALLPKIHGKGRKFFVYFARNP